MNWSRPPRVLVHPDFLRLEAALAAGIAGTQERRREGGEWFPRILVLVATRRQAQRVRRVLVDSPAAPEGSRTALAGMEILTHLALARKVLESSGGRTPEIADRPLREAIVDRICRLTPDAELSRYAGRHTGVVPALAGVLGELREAGITPAELQRAAYDAESRELASLHELYGRGLERLAAGEDAPATTDRAGFVFRAAAALPGLAEAGRFPEYAAVFQYGASDLVGMNLDLLRAVPSRDPVTLLVPAHPEAPAFAFARDFLHRHGGGEPELLDDGDGTQRPFVRAACAYRNPGAEPDPLPEGALDFLHAQGPEAELTVAVRAALKLIRDGVDPAEVAIVARSLAPYTAVAESVFERHGLRPDSSLTFPLARWPRPRAFLNLVRALAGDFERQPVIDLVRSPHLIRPDDIDEDLWTPDLWDRLSRRYRIVRGASEWTATLPEAVAGEPLPQAILEETDEAGIASLERERDARAGSVRVLGKLVALWETASGKWNSCRSATDHARFLAALGATWIEGWEGTDAPADALRDLVDGLASLEAATAAAGAATGSDDPARRMSREEILAHVERAVGETEIPWSAPGGVAFLDFMQARGLVFDHVFLLGFNADLVPHRPRENPLLPDHLRRRLREATGRPLAVKSEGLDEEYQLLAQAVAMTRSRLTVSWQRADADGKALPASLQLRELLRCAPGSPALRPFLEGEEGAGLAPSRVPTHPAETAGWMAATLGMLSREEASLCVARRAGRRGPEAVASFLNALEPPAAADLDDRLAMLTEIERFGGGDLRYDARAGTGHLRKRPFSATGLERLGRCPQTFFFRDVLGVHPLDEAAEEMRLGMAELGGLVHQVLENVFRIIRDLADRHPEKPLTAFRERAREVLEEQWTRVLAAAGRRIRGPYPALWEALESVWRAELSAYLQRELERLTEAGHRIELLEETWSAEIRLQWPQDEPDTLSLRGKLDRVTRGPGRILLVSDYKTGSGRLSEWLQPKAILSGQKLQLPLYVLLAEAQEETTEVSAELIGLGPGFLPDRGFLREGPSLLTQEALAKRRPSLDETLSVFLGLAREGRFPFRSGRHCTYCDFRPACRRHHHPSRVRLQSHPATEPYYLAVEKNSLRKTIEAVRRHRGEEES